MLSDVNPDNKLALWIHAARPKTLWAAFAPVLMGSAMSYADGGFHLLTAIACLVFAFLIQIGTNFCNDYADFKKGADTETRTGPLRITQAGLVRPEQVLLATCAVYGLAVVVSFYLLARVGFEWIILVIACVASGVLYTAGPRPLGYVGLGDLFVLLFFGPIAVGGTYYMQTLDMSLLPFIAGLGPGLLSVAILVVNNIRDRNEDLAAGKKTLVARFGRRFGMMEYVLSILIALAIVPLLVVMTGAHYWALVSLVIVLLAVAPVRQLLRHEGHALNPVLGETARLLLVYSLLFSIGWII